MPQIRGVLLDMDGTLIDSNDAHAHSWVTAFRENGYDVPFERIRPLIGMGGDNLIPEVVPVDPKSDEGKRISKAWEATFKRDYLPNLKPFPQVRKLLESMRAEGMKLVIASSAKEDLLGAMLEIVGIKDLIENKTSADDAESSKPDPDIIHAALQEIGLPAPQVLMLGDTPYDIESAAKAGVSVVAVRCGGFSDNQLRGALAIYDDPADLVARFDSSPFKDT